MQKKIKLLLITALVSIAVIGTVGSASAWYGGTVYPTEDMLVLTQDVPVWPATGPLGDFVPSASSLGLLRQMSLDDANFTYNATFNNTTGDVTILDINGNAATGGYTWKATLINNTLIDAGNIAVTAPNGSGMIFTLMAANGSLKDMVFLYVNTKQPAFNVSGNVTVSSGSTALDVLNASVAQGLISSYNVTWVPDYDDPATGYAWLVDINGVTARDWTTSGYGYALVQDGNMTASIDQTYFTANSTYRIFMGASIYGGNYNDTLIGGEYYATGIAESLMLNVTVE